MFEFVTISPGLVLPHSFVGCSSLTVNFLGESSAQFINYMTYRDIFISYDFDESRCAEIARHYLQPVMETLRALWAVHALNVEVVSKV